MSDFKIDPDYVEVPQRIREFYTQHPNGALRPLDKTRPYTIERIGDDTFLTYVAGCWLDKDDPEPAGVGSAWEPVPGKTPYTRDSEMQNAETSAWGRAIVAAGKSQSKKVASAEDIANANARNTEYQRLVGLKKQAVAAAGAKGMDVPAMRTAFSERFGHSPDAATSEEIEQFIAELSPESPAAQEPHTPSEEPDPTPPGEGSPAQPDPDELRARTVQRARDAILADVPEGAAKNPHAHFAALNLALSQQRIADEKVKNVDGHEVTLRALLEARMTGQRRAS